METAKTNQSERFFERSLKRHYSKLTERGVEPDEACAIAIQLATRPDPQRALEEDEEELPPQTRRPSLRSFKRAIARANEGGDVDKLVEQLRVLFANPNNLLTPFVRSRSSSDRVKERSRHAKDPSPQQPEGDTGPQPLPVEVEVAAEVAGACAPPPELTPEQALELALGSGDFKPGSSDSGSTVDLISSNELGSLFDSKPTSSGSSPRSVSPPAAPSSPPPAAPPPPAHAPDPPEPKPARGRALHTAPLPAPVLQPGALAAAAAVAFGPSAFDAPPAPATASSPLRRIPSGGLLGSGAPRPHSKPTPPRPRTSFYRPTTPDPTAARHQSGRQPQHPPSHDHRAPTPPPAAAPRTPTRADPRSRTPEPAGLRPTVPHFNPAKPRADPRARTPEPPPALHRSATQRQPAPHSDDAARSLTPEGMRPELMTRLDPHQRFEPPRRALARHRSVPRQWSETRLAEQLGLPRSLSDNKHRAAASADAADAHPGARQPRGGSRFATEALHQRDADARPASGGRRPDDRPAADQLPPAALAADAAAAAEPAPAAPADQQQQQQAAAGEALAPVAEAAGAAAEGKGEAQAEAPKPIPDIQAIHDFYQALQPLAQKHKDIEGQLVAGGRRMRRWVAAWAPNDRKRVPIAVVCLLNPVLDNPEHHHQVTKPFILAMAESSRDVKAQLQWLLKSAPADAFSRIIQTLQQYITLAIFAAPWRHVPPSGVQAAVRLLAVLWRSNQDAPRVPHTEFYNDAVNSPDCPVTVKQDHARWRATKGKEFTFCKYPFIYDPAAKTELLYCENYHQQYAEVEGAVVRAVLGGQQVLCPYLVLRVRRGRHLVPDTLEQINAAKYNHTLKKPLKVQFIGEQGVDEGGVQKELFQLLQRELFNPDYGMFTYDTTTRLHWFRPSPLNLQSEFELVGVLIGLAIYNGHLLDLSFPLVLYRLLLGQAPGLQHLHELYPDIAESLKKLLTYEGDMADLSLTFEATVERGFGQYQQVELVPGGADVAVTVENREEYVRLYVKHLLQGSVQRQLGAFLKGFHRMCSGDTLDFLLPEELEQLVCGSRQLDMVALQHAAQYEGGYSRHSKVVRWFWDIVHNELTPRQHKRLLSFMTGTERVPLKGLAALSPPPVIARAGPHSARLPTAHTCFNHLLLPDYADRATLRDRLRLAIDNAEGFGLI